MPNVEKKSGMNSAIKNGIYAVFNAPFISMFKNISSIFPGNEIILSGSLVTPSGIPAIVVMIIDKIMPPGIFFIFTKSIRQNPIKQRITSGDLKSPNVRLFFFSLAAISPQLFAPSRAMNSPIPALTACLRLTGITFTTASRSPRKEIAIKSIPLRNITPAAFSGEMPSFVIMDTTIPVLPSPGASANGLFV